MLSLLSIVAIIAGTPNPGLEAVSGLSGCWKGVGTVQGEAVTSIAKGKWHLGQRYFLLQLHSTSADETYSATIIYGAGEQPNTIGSYWLDTFGGTASLPVSGAPTADGFIVEYHFPDTTYANRFARVGKAWRWTIIEQAKGKADKPFASYDLNPTSCRGLKFDF